MKKLLLSILLCGLLSLAVLPGLAQEGSQSVSADYLMTLRPLGRIHIDGGYVTYNPDGYHIATIRTVVLPPIVHSLRPDATPDDITPNTPPYGQRQENYPPINLYWLNMWDIRGGDLMWSLRLPVFNNLDGLAFSPQGSTVLVRLSAIENSENILLMIFDMQTGTVISTIDELDVAQLPVIPGNIPQRLSAEAAFTPSGEYVIVGYQRLAEDPHCALWRVADGQLVWDQAAGCGTFSQDGRYMVRPEPHANPFSTYLQITVYDVPTGEVVAASQDEIVDYIWIDTTRLLLNRPYGDAPVIWDIVNDTRAFVEQPYHLGSTFYPNKLQNILFTAYGENTFVWSKTTGGLLLTTDDPVEQLVEVDGKILELTTDPAWYEKEPEERQGGFVAYDFLTGAEVWQNRWQHSPSFLFSPNYHLALTVDQTTEYLQIFDMQTGEMVGELPTLYDNFTFTPHWDWVYQSSGSVYTVWGPVSEIDRFENQPNGMLRDDAKVYSYPSYTAQVGKLRRGEYIWVLGRAGGFDGWAWIEMANGAKYWIEIGKTKLFETFPNLPILTD